MFEMCNAFLHGWIKGIFSNLKKVHLWIQFVHLWYAQHTVCNEKNMHNRKMWSHICTLFYVIKRWKNMKGNTQSHDRTLNRVMGVNHIPKDTSTESWAKCWASHATTVRSFTLRNDTSEEAPLEPEKLQPDGFTSQRNSLHFKDVCLIQTVSWTLNIEANASKQRFLKIDALL